MSCKLSCTVLRGGISGNAGSLLDQKQEFGKQAFHIHRQDHQLFAFAGLWEHWQQEEQALYSCAILTMEAADLMRPIHERMPVIIPQRHYHQWLDKADDGNQAYNLIGSGAYAEMEASLVSDWVNNPQHDDERCIE